MGYLDWLRGLRKSDAQEDGEEDDEVAVAPVEVVDTGDGEEIADFIEPRYAGPRYDDD